MSIIKNYLQILKEYPNIVIKKLNDEEKQEFNEIFDIYYKDETEHEYFCAFLKNEMIGGMAIRHELENSEKKIYKDLDPQIIITFFYVLDQYRSMGIGRELFEFVYSKYDRIAVVTDNSGKYTTEKIIELYKRRGFKVIKKLSNNTFWYIDKNKL